MWVAPALRIAVLSWPLLGCSELVDPGITYHCDRDGYAENFVQGDDLDDLANRCWLVDNVVEGRESVFLDDGDLEIRATAPNGGPREQWAGDDQAPMAYQTFDGDFIMVARVEALNKVSADHCLPEGNLAGLVLRQGGTDWATFMLGPFTPDDVDPMPDCTDDSENLPPTQGVVRSRDEVFGADFVIRGEDDEGIGEDGESDLAVCRVDNSIVYYHRDPESPETKPEWVQLDGTHAVASGALDVGLTVTGQDPSYEVSGHFNWVVFAEGKVADGCNGALSKVKLPKEED